jgi:hypothetical protein
VVTQVSQTFHAYELQLAQDADGKAPQDTSGDSASGLFL